MTNHQTQTDVAESSQLLTGLLSGQDVLSHSKHLNINLISPADIPPSVTLFVLGRQGLLIPEDLNNNNDKTLISNIERMGINSDKTVLFSGERFGCKRVFVFPFPKIADEEYIDHVVQEINQYFERWNITSAGFQFAEDFFSLERIQQILVKILSSQTEHLVDIELYFLYSKTQFNPLLDIAVTLKNLLAKENIQISINH